MQPLRIALAQVAPRLGDLEANLARHAELDPRGAGRRRRPGRLPGARPHRLPAAGPRRRGRDARRRPAPRGARRRDRRLLGRGQLRRGVGRPSPLHRRRPPRGRAASATCTARSTCPPTASSTSAASSPRATRSGPCRRGSGVGLGLAICEDFWHLGTAQAAGPRRRPGPRQRLVVARAATWPPRTPRGSGTAASWRTLLRTYAQLTTSVVVFCNRVGVDESISFWGGSEVIGPAGESLVQAPALRRGAGLRRRGARRHPPRADRPAPAARRAPRAAGPRAASGSWPSAPGWRPTRPATPELGRDRRRSSPAPGLGARATSRPAGSERRPAGAGCPFELPEELRIDTDVARRVIARLHPRASSARPASSGPSWGSPGGIDSALVAYLVAEAIGAERLLCVLMPYRTSSPASRADAEEVVRRLGCASRLVDISPIVDGYFGAPSGVAGGRGGPEAPGRLAAAARQLHGPGPDDGPLRRVGHLGRPRRRAPATRRSRSSATRRSSATAPAPSTRSATSTRPRSASCRWRWASPTRSSRKAPSADLWPGQTDETEAGFTYHELDRLLFWMIDRRRTRRRAGGDGLRPRPTIARVDRMVAGVGVQAPGAADREARAADGRRRLPVPAPPAGQRAVVSRAARASGRARVRRERTAAARGEPGGARAAASSWSRRRSATSPTSRCGRSRCCGSVPLVAAEDTRLTRRLFARHGLATRLVSYHARNAAARGPELLAHLRGGADLALVTDAGHAARLGSRRRARRGLGRRGRHASCRSPGRRPCWRRSSRPGWPARAGSFEGFLPRSGRERRERLARLAADPRTSRPLRGARAGWPPRWPTSPAACGPERPAAVCRELTKLHEEVRRGRLAELAAAAADGAIAARGEMVVVVGDGARPTAARRRRAPGEADEEPLARGAGRGRAPRRERRRPRRRRAPGRGRDRASRVAASTAPTRTARIGA